VQKMACMRAVRASTVRRRASARRSAPLLLLSLLLPGPAQAAADVRLPPPSYPAALDLHQAGRSREALAALDRTLGDVAPAELPVEALLLRATLLGAAGRAAEGEALWRDVGAREPALDVFARRRLIASLAARGEAAKADAALRDLIGTGAPAEHLDLMLSVADAHRTTNGEAAAAALYRRLLAAQRTGPLADPARLGLALALEPQEPAGALAAFRDAQLHHRTVDAYLAARVGERRVAARLQRPVTPFTEAEYAALTRRLRERSRWDEALELHEEWRRIRTPAQGTEDIEADIIDTLYNKRANDEAMSRILAFGRQYPSSPRLAQIRLTEFRLDVREGRTPDVRKKGLAYWRGGVPGASLAQRRSAALLLAAYLVSVGLVEDGLGVFRELYQASPAGDDRVGVLWRAGLAAIRARQDERAATNLRAALNLQPAGAFGSASRYWLGVAEERLGRRDAAFEHWTRLARQHPYDYYGLRAAERLRAAGQPIPTPANRTFPPLELSAAAVVHPHYTGAVHLARAGLDAEAADYAGRLLAARPGDRTVALLAARAAHTAGQYRRSFGIAVTHFRPYVDHPTSNLPPDFHALVYPRAFWDEVREAAQQQRVDPLLLLAIMRQESLFDPEVRSPVGAIGLFQIMSYTAEEIGPEAGVRDPDEASLLQPAVSAAIAARYVRRLLDLFDGALAPVIASYNAGEDRAGAWWTAATGLPDDLFIDSIPYTETRNYVRIVWTNYQRYRGLYPESRQPR
jgi:soluble lytic murein transglycosylase-like protein